MEKAGKTGGERKLMRPFNAGEETINRLLLKMGMERTVTKARLTVAGTMHSR